MTIYVEKNSKYGAGLQLRIEDETRESVVDYGPYDSVQAAKMARKMLEVYNRENGTDFQIEDVLEGGDWDGESGVEVSLLKKGEADEAGGASE